MKTQTSIAALALMASAQLHAVTILPAQVNQGVGTTTSTSFDVSPDLSTATVTTVPSEIDVTFEGFQGGVSTAFSSVAPRLGIVGSGSNGAFNDPTKDVAGDTQTLVITIANSSLGLGGLTYDFSRADSANGGGFGVSAGEGGIFISGFLFDPRIAIPDGTNDPTGLLTGSVTNRDNTTATGGDLNPTEVYYSAGVLEIEQTAFAGTPNHVIIALDPAASFGQTLTFTPVDEDQDGAQFAPLSFDIVPEPSVALLGAISLFGLLRRRR